MKTKILIADDNRAVRDGLKMLIRHLGDMEVIGEAENGQTAVEMAREALPDIILMDVDMPVMGGIEATRLIHAEMPGIRILALSMYSDERHSSDMLQAGARIYIRKDDDVDRLIAAIRAAAGSSGSSIGAPGAPHRDRVQDHADEEILQRAELVV